MTTFSSLERNHIFNKLESEDFDILIIGGGITGAGIALDAAARGLKTAVVEMQDFASGTSSRSTKIVHGGFRYLKQFEIKEVADLARSGQSSMKMDHMSRRLNGCFLHFMKAEHSGSYLRHSA